MIVPSKTFIKETLSQAQVPQANIYKRDNLTGSKIDTFMATLVGDYFYSFSNLKPHFSPPHLAPPILKESLTQDFQLLIFSQIRSPLALNTVLEPSAHSEFLRKFANLFENKC
jgi:hypothetical protein